LPLLPRLGGEILVRRHPADLHLYELPFAGVDGCAHARTRAPEHGERPIPAMESGESIARICFFRSQHSCAKRSRLLDLPRASGRDAADVESAIAVHAVVPRLPRSARAIRPAKGGGLQHEMGISGRSNRARTQTGFGKSDRDSAVARLRGVPPMKAQLDLDAIRARLDGVRGQHYWRSLEEVAQTKEFQEMMHREFPAGASEWWDGLNRRNFLKLAAASLALS